MWARNKFRYTSEGRKYHFEMRQKKLFYDKKTLHGNYRQMTVYLLNLQCTCMMYGTELRKRIPVDTKDERAGGAGRVHGRPCGCGGQHYQGAGDPHHGHTLD